MGCDIHMYIEYGYKKRNTERKEKNEPEYWNSFGGKINAGRNYVMFGHLAGVRSEVPNPLKPKGLPDFETLGYKSRGDAFLFIRDKKDDNDEDSCTLENAKRWGGKIIERDGKPIFTEHPDWHSHSWLTTKEFADVINDYDNNKDNWGNVIEYKAILAAMETLEKTGEYDARVVFWFDN